MKNKRYEMKKHGVIFIIIVIIISYSIFKPFVRKRTYKSAGIRAATYTTQME